MAADAVRAPEMVRLSLFENYLGAVRRREPWVDDEEKPLPIPPAAGGLSSSSTELDVMRAKAKLARGVIDLVRRGNRKPVFDPRTNLDGLVLFPEYSRFKDISKHLTSAAYVEFADGRSSAGTDLLLESLKFSNNISSGSFIGSLVSVAGTSMALAGFERHLPALSLADAERVDRTAAELLSQPLTYLAALRREQEFALSGVRQLLSDPEGTAADLLVPGEVEGVEEANFVRIVKGLTPAEREVARLGASAQIEADFTAYIAIFTGPESRWYKRPDDAGAVPARLRSAADLPAYLAEMVRPGQFSMGWLGRSRTQLRLLRLHARIAGHRWRNNALPKSLSEVASPEEIADPFAESQIVYELKDGGTGYRLYGKGNRETGEIDLKYRRQPGAGSERELPPDPAASHRHRLFLRQTQKIEFRDGS